MAFLFEKGPPVTPPNAKCLGNAQTASGVEVVRQGVFGKPTHVCHLIGMGRWDILDYRLQLFTQERENVDLVWKHRRRRRNRRGTGPRDG
uniref:Uncharacterized protein n=1 Tax=Candidatus Kentrum sp. LPFa TaxID=2126335 RepID=A0A450VUN5_9GAMM|nr:MAG: hypothetical protein BECKLPF1236A_GA0070988_1001728 [Candidatus Kentron sp. LPFa]VFK24725.1 MAG: hypothetical protein BECKLPF1236C_GA0070990_1001529 [Candidatus Kentron sp. LPFa]